MSATHADQVVSVGSGEGALSRGRGLDLRYGLEDKPGPAQSILFGLQHVLVMFTAMIASPLVISQLLNLSPQLRTTMVTGVMLGCGVGTIISSLGVGAIGSRLPLVLGAYTVYIVPVVAIGKTAGLGAATTALALGGLFLFVASPLIGKLRGLFPPVVVGTLLVLTGITLMKIGVTIAAGIHTPYLGKPLTLFFLVGSILLILAVNRLTTGFLRSLSVFIALVCLYVVSIVLGLTNFTPVLAAPWFQLPTFAPFGPFAWPGAAALVTIIIYNLVAAIYTMSITLALCEMVGVEGTERRVRGAIAADGLGSFVAALFGGVPLTSYDQNVGVVSLTGVGSRFVVAVGGAILVIMALLPKIGAIIAIVPPFVLGGTLIFMFGMIVAIGVGILAGSIKGQRDVLLFAASIGMCAAADFAPPSLFEALPVAMRHLASDGIFVGTVTAIILQILLPQRRD